VTDVAIVVTSVTSHHAMQLESLRPLLIGETSGLPLQLKIFGYDSQRVLS